MAHSTADRDGETSARRRGSGRRLMTVGLVAAVAVLGLARPAAAEPSITGLVRGPSGTAFGRTVTFNGEVVNSGTADFSNVFLSPLSSTGLSGVTISPVGQLRSGELSGFQATAQITGAPGSVAQLRLQATGITDGPEADPSVLIVGAPFTVTEAVVLTVTAERREAGVLSPCPAGCSVSIDDGIKYSVTVSNLSGVSAFVSISAPVPPNTSPAGTSSIPAGEITLAAGSSQTFAREVTVNDPVDDTGPPQPGDVIAFSPGATYRISSPPLASRSAGGSPAVVTSTVVDPRLLISNDMTDVNGGELSGGDVVASTVRIENTGNAIATNTVLAVTLTDLQNPTDVRIDGVPVPSDQLTVAGSTLTVRVGAGAGSSSGGSLAPDAVTVVSFSSVVVTSPSADPPTAQSVASVSFDNGGLSPRTASAQLAFNVTHLRLVKEVVNDDGGTAAATDFTLVASGPTPVSGVGGADVDINPGTYALSETGPAGYSAADWVCTGGGVQSGDAITLSGGEAATCTITNDDIRPRLTLFKQVVNDDGRTAVPADFTLVASGPTPLTGAGAADGEVSPGTYSLSETGPAGYSPSGWVCSGSGSQSGASITLAVGQAATCTITNNDNPRVSDLGVSISATPGIVKSGGVVTYTVTVANHGPDAASVVLSDALPSTTNFRGISPGQATCTTPAQGASGAVICQLASVASGASAVVRIDVNVGAVRKTTITNTVTVALSGGGTDPVSANDAAAITVRVK